MKYEAPKLTALMPAINAIESSPSFPKGSIYTFTDSLPPHDNNESDVSAYQDWE
jgi:hypothetical protein